MFTDTTKKSKRKKHTRTGSVAQSVPMKYLSKAPTLIALLDVQHDNNINPLETIDDTTNTMTAIAANEFTELANENNELFKEVESLKAKYDDLLDYKTKIESELNTYKHQSDIDTQIVDDIEIFKSTITKLKLENTVLLEQLNDNKHNRSRTRTISTDKYNGSESEHNFLKETLSRITHEKNELENILEEEKQKQIELTNIIKELRIDLTSKNSAFEQLSNNLNKQQKAYLSLATDLKKHSIEVEQSLGTNVELTHTVDEQQAYIQQLKIENERLLVEKEKDDNQMFMELEQLRNTKFARSVRNVGQNRLKTQMNIFNNIHMQDLENDTWDGLNYDDEYDDGNYYNNEYETHINNPLILNTLDEIDEIEHIEDEVYETDEDFEKVGVQNVNINDEAEKNNYSENDGVTEHTITPFENEDEKANDNVYEIEEKNNIENNNIKNKDIIGEEKEKEKEEEYKEDGTRDSREVVNDMMNMEMDFFLLCCISIKGNLAEEYPDKLQVMNEDAMKLFVIAKKQHIEMRKFNLWIEMQLRHKYDLPKLKGFKKFAKKYNIKNKAKEKYKNMKKYAKYGSDYELPEIIRKYKKHKQDEDDEKKDLYLKQIKTYCDDLFDEFKSKKSEYISQFEYNDAIEMRFFNDLFMRLCKFLYYTRLCGATFNEFEKYIENICDGIKYDKITLNDMQKYDIWSNIYKAHLNYVIISAEEECKLFGMYGYQSFCNKSVQFIKACYKTNYAKCSGVLSHYICEYIAEKGMMNDFKNHQVIDGIISIFIKILNDKKNFLKMLYKSIERGNKKPKINTNTEYQLYYKMHLNNVQIEGAYEQILAIMIVNIYCIEKDNDISLFNANENIINQNDDILKKINEMIEIVMDKCDELCLDDKTKVMVKYFFAYYFTGENPFDGVCSVSGVSCIVQ